VFAKYFKVGVVRRLQVLPHIVRNPFNPNGSKADLSTQKARIAFARSDIFLYNPGSTEPWLDEEVGDRMYGALIAADRGLMPFLSCGLQFRENINCELSTFPLRP
jgi:hypothetical protein